MGGNNNLQGDNKRRFLLYLLQNQHGFYAIYFNFSCALCMSSTYYSRPVTPLQKPCKSITAAMYRSYNSLVIGVKNYLKDLNMTIERPLHIFCNTVNYVGRGARGTWVEILELRASFASCLMGHLRLHVEKLFCRCRNNISYVY